MKSMRYIVSTAVLLSSATAAMACGPYPSVIPDPVYLKADDIGQPDYLNLERQENLMLYRQLTDSRIPLADIEQAVYRDSSSRLYNRFYSDGNDDNKFYMYLHNTGDEEILHLLVTAKNLEERRAKARSPWYYPASHEDSLNDYTDIIEECLDYKGTRLADRYGLQAVRAYFASGQYDECINYYGRCMASLPDNNLFKRMALRYVGGSWVHLGDDTRADECYDMADHTYNTSAEGDSPQLWYDILNDCAGDSTALCGLIPMATEMIHSNKSRHKGGWEFVLAYALGCYRGDTTAARRHMARAMAGTFVSDDLRDHARAYRMALDGDAGDRSRLLSDLQWIESKVDPLDLNCNHWASVIQNIVYVHWVPTLYRQADYTTAVFLAAYADNARLDYYYCSNWPRKDCATVGQMRADKSWRNYRDYGALSFRLMESLTSDQLLGVMRSLGSSDPLLRLLQRHARTDTDYYRELAGTLAMREQNYRRAVDCLSAVNPDYQEHLNIYKDGYLARNPFALPWSPRLPDSRDAKLNFARRMLALQQTARHGATANDRGLAALEYALALKNSFEYCWTLTRYWKGDYIDTLDYPYTDYWANDSFELDFIYDYTGDDSDNVLRRCFRQVDEALSMLTDDEARATAMVMLGERSTVIRKYGHTRQARHLRSVCDNWRDWL